LFNIGFLEIRFLDIIDVILVGLLMYQLYRLVRGSLAFNIFIGLLIIYLISLVVRSLDMELLSGILGQFIGVGVIALLIVFQPEVRRFLLYVGKGSRFGQSDFWSKLSVKNWRVSTQKEMGINAIITAVDELSKTKTGALIVYTISSRLQFIANTGVLLNAEISSQLLQSIFQKNSSLHDGAVIISDNRIVAAKCVLPVSESTEIPSRYGMRHRSAVGMSEHSDALTIIVSEETGQISYTFEGKLFPNINIAHLREVLINNLENIHESLVTD
jgi:diadenylate cyclase